MNNMEQKKGNSQADTKIIDLQSFPCPMNLVNFKFHFHQFNKIEENFIVLANEEGLKNIKNFLNYKGVAFESLTERSVKIFFKQT